jgi:glycosyltransferase involved in cell wall biosynthesis
MRLAILEQSFGRFGGAERLVLSHYQQLNKMNVDAELFYGGAISDEWMARLGGLEIRPLTAGIPRNFREFRLLKGFLGTLSHFDRILIHHHVEPILAFYVTKFFGEKTIWYSGSVLEFAWEEFITGLDYRSISPTVKKTSQDFYGRLFSSIALSDFTFNHAVRMARLLDIRSVKRCRKVLANSRFLSKFLFHVYGLGNFPRVVYPGPDPILRQLSDSLSSSEEDYMLTVAPFIPMKNIESVILAAATIPSATVVAVGDGQERERIIKFAEERKVELRVVSSSPNERKLASLYCGCKFLVHLSLYEPFGLTVVEAGLFGKPSIVTNRGGPPEVVVDGQTGFIVNPRDVREVGMRMRELLANDTLRREMGKKARARVLENFTLEKSTTDLLAEVES